MTKRKPKKPYTVEWRAKEGELFRDWSVYSRYKTEKDRDKGLLALSCSGHPMFEFRAGNPRRLSKAANQKLNKIEVDKMNFGEAIEAAKNGKKITRSGWNGKGQWVVLMPALKLPPFSCQEPGAKVNDRTAKHIGTDTPLDSQPYFSLWTAQGKWQPGWVASVSDTLAEDWQVAE